MGSINLVGFWSTWTASCSMRTNASDPMCRLFYPKKILARPLETKDNTTLTTTMSEIRDLRRCNKSLDFMIYVMRKTSGIANNKPVDEISLFTVHNDHLIQFGVDAWTWPAEMVNLFEMERSTVMRVAYLPTFDFRALVPFDMLANTMPDDTAEITCFIACGPKNGLNFDVKKRQNIHHARGHDVCSTGIVYSDEM